MQQDLLSRGLELMVFGMGTVLIFLSLLVLATGVMSRLIQRYFPDPEPEPAAVSSVPQGIRPADEDQQLLAVISAAVHRYRSRR